MSKLDLTGQKFNMLTVLEEDLEYKKLHNIKGNRRFWKCKCDCGNEVIRTGDALRLNTNSSCGCTTESIGVSYIKKLLINNNIPFVQEKTFDTCRFPDSNALARFDFYINNQFLVEYDGQQHYTSNEYGHYTKESFNKLKEHDKFKNKWCIDNHIVLKRIPFWRINTLTLDNIMDDTFLIKNEE